MKKFYLAIVILGLSLGVGCGLGGSSSSNPSIGTFGVQSTPAPPIVFASDRHGNGLMELYYMNPDGTEQTRVPLPAEYAGLVWDPVVSPDGTRIVFSYYGLGFADLYSVKLDGTDLKALTTGADSYLPRFSPDGSKIVFVRYTESYLSHVWLMNSDGSGLVDITMNSTRHYDSADFSPDGTKIIASRDADLTARNTSAPGHSTLLSGRPSLISGEAAHEIVTMNPDGSAETVIATEADENGAPQFSADGSKVIFAAQLQENTIVSETLADHVRTQLTSPSVNSYDPLVRDDYIYFVSTRDGNPAVYRMDANGANTIRLTDPTSSSSLGRAIH